MPDQEFIHSCADVRSTLLYALDSGFQVRVDEPQEEPRARVLAPTEIEGIHRGSFDFVRPEWVWGPFQTMPISRGYNSGKFFVSPRVNFTGVSVYFQGERLDRGHRRFGDCAVSCHRDWLEMPGKIVRPAPPDVQEWFTRIVEHLDSGLLVQAGVHRYHISRGVVSDATREQCLPPFDFIPWGRDLFKGHGKQL